MRRHRFNPPHTLATHANAANILAKVVTNHGLVDVIDRRLVWEEIGVDGDGNLAIGSGRRFVYDAAAAAIRVLTDMGGLYVAVEDL